MQWTLHKSHIEHTTDTLYLAHYGAPLVFWIKKNTKYLPWTSKLEQQFWRPAHSPPRDAGQRRYCMPRQYLAAPEKNGNEIPMVIENVVSITGYSVRQNLGVE